MYGTRTIIAATVVGPAAWTSLPIVILPVGGRVAVDRQNVGDGAAEDRGWFGEDRRKGSRYPCPAFHIRVLRRLPPLSSLPGQIPAQAAKFSLEA